MSGESIVLALSYRGRRMERLLRFIIARPRKTATLRLSWFSLSAYIARVFPSVFFCHDAVGIRYKPTSDLVAKDKDKALTILHDARLEYDVDNRRQSIVLISGQSRLIFFDVR